MSDVEGVPRDGVFTIYGEALGGPLGPDSFNVIFGQTVEGGVDSLHESDNEYLRILNWPALSLTLPVIRMIAETHTQVDDPSSIVITVEAAADSQPDQPLQRVQAFDFIAKQWVTIDERVATQSDSSIQVTLDADDEPLRFIEPDTGRLRLRLDWFDPGPVVNVGWGVRIDQVQWEVTQ